MMVLFDRKMLRNFRKDGHNWKKKKDGKTVKEAHEHLKVRLLYLVHNWDYMASGGRQLDKQMTEFWLETQITLL